MVDDIVPSEDTLRAQVVAVLYREFSIVDMPATDALMNKTLLAKRVAPLHPDKARRVIHEMAADEDVPIRLRMEGSAVEFTMEDENRLRDWAIYWVQQHDRDCLPLG